jgi:hypothetical protein
MRLPANATQDRELVSRCLLIVSSSGCSARGQAPSLDSQLAESLLPGTHRRTDRLHAGKSSYTSYRHKLAFLERLEIQREQRVQLLLVRGMRLF